MVSWAVVANTLVLLVLALMIAGLHRLLWRLVEGLARSGRAAADRLPQSPLWGRLTGFVGALAERLPPALHWLLRRLDWRHFTGLPLTLLVLAGGWLFGLLIGLSEDRLSEAELQHLDEAINALLQPLRGQPLIGVFAWFTALGAAPAMTGLTVLGTACFWAYRRRNLLPGLWLTLLGAQLTTWTGKYLFGRPRPEFVTAVTAVSPSFPSGHATSAMAVIGFLCYALTREPLPLRARFEFVYWSIVVIGLIGASRLFLSVHYASDVAAGFLVGGFWLLVGVGLAEYLRARRPPGNDDSP